MAKKGASAAENEDPEKKQKKKANRYTAIIAGVFEQNYITGASEIFFQRADIETCAEKLKVKLPKNLGDLIYSFRYRSDLPESVSKLAPKGKAWIIWPAGRAKYKFIASAVTQVLPNKALAETKIPDATPGIIGMYALSDEQALLAKLRYNRLLDVFTGVTTYSLQSHLRTTVEDMGQVETDELYVGLDRRGIHYAIPVQAKGGRDKLSVVQIGQDVAMCKQKFPSLVCRPVAAQFMENDTIALFEFEASDKGVAVLMEKHYRLVPAEEMSEGDLRTYAKRPDSK